MNKKKIMSFAIFGIFIIGLAFATAGLINYYSQKQVNMEVSSPTVFNGETQLSEDVTLIAGNGYNLYLVEGENKLDRDVDVKFEFALLDGEGSPLADTAGFYLAYSDDIEYAYKPEYGNAADWSEAQTWMNNNLDWFDWYLTGAIADYDSSIMTNYNGDSAYANAIAFNTEIPQTLSPGKFYAVVYMDVDEAVTPGDYTLSINLMPTA